MKNIIFTLLFAFTNINSFAFDLSALQSFFGKDYKSAEECQNFSPKVNYQKDFVILVCTYLFPVNTELSKTAKGRLLCLRQNIENANTNELSRKVIFDCYERYPSKDKSAGLRLAQHYFKTQEELMQEQMQEQARRNLYRNSPPPLIFFDMW